MIQPTTFTTLGMALLSVLTSVGLAIHDTHVDQALATTTVRPAIVSYEEPEQQSPKPLGGGGHAHIDYNPLSQALNKTFAYPNPTIAPRRDSHIKQLVRTLEMGGRHAFDNANLPLLD